LTPETITFTPIGRIHSPFAQPAGTPIQPKAGENTSGQVEVYPEYAAGLVDLDGFSHIILLYWCHMAKPFTLTVMPFLDQQPHGVFATRAPARPNAIGLSVVRLERIDGLTLHIRDVDIVDGAPLLDIKPYVPAFDQRDVTRVGWLAGQLDDLPSTRDDGRFTTD
jgi:tRNA-Thr(GGU) m(6)t(6)A37 methyltransferase TsaA